MTCQKFLGRFPDFGGFEMGRVTRDEMGKIIGMF